jgi:hypothetical protein
VRFYFTVCSIRLVAIIFSSFNFNKTFGRRLQSKPTLSLAVNRDSALVSELIITVYNVYIHTYTCSQNTTIKWYYYVFYITVQNTTTCFGLYRPSSGYKKNLKGDYIKGWFIWQGGGRDLALQCLMGWWIVIHGIRLIYSKHRCTYLRTDLDMYTDAYYVYINLIPCITIHHPIRHCKARSRPPPAL